MARYRKKCRLRFSSFAFVSRRVVGCEQRADLSYYLLQFLILIDYTPKLFVNLTAAMRLRVASVGSCGSSYWEFVLGSARGLSEPSPGISCIDLDRFPQSTSFVTESLGISADGRYFRSMIRSSSGKSADASSLITLIPKRLFEQG